MTSINMFVIPIYQFKTIRLTRSGAYPKIRDEGMNNVSLTYLRKFLRGISEVWRELHFV